MTNQTLAAKVRFDRIIDIAHIEFWEVIAAEYSEAKTGDLSPNMTHQLERAMRDALAEWIDNNVPVTENKTVEIMFHTIEYRFKGSELEIDECGIEHINEMIIAGYDQGELFTINPDDENNNQSRGEWSIKK